MSCSSALLCWVGGCKQGPRNPSTHTAQPCPTQVLHHLCLSPGLPLPSVLEEMTGKKGLEEKDLGKADFSSPVLCINILNGLLSSPLCLVSLDLTICSTCLAGWHTAGPGKAPPKITKALDPELLMVPCTDGLENFS